MLAGIALGHKLIQISHHLTQVTWAHYSYLPLIASICICLQLLPTIINFVEFRIVDNLNEKCRTELLCAMPNVLFNGHQKVTYEEIPKKMFFVNDIQSFMSGFQNTNFKSL